MKPVFYLWGWLLALLVPGRLWAATYYVAPTGSDVASGAESQPFASMARAQVAVSPGDSVYFRGGTYIFKSATDVDGVALDKSGLPGNTIKYWAYPNEVPVFDFSRMTAPARLTGFRVTGSYLHFKGLELKGLPQTLDNTLESWAIYILGGSNDIFELLNLHHNMGPGLFIAKGGNNLVLNCDSHHNFDPKSKGGPGTNADGFGCHSFPGETGNVFRGCRAWWNGDDGFDFIHANEVVVVENSWAWNNGYVPDTMVSGGDGNGFKAGGFGLPPVRVPPTVPSHVVRFCVAFQNRAAGFYQNHNPVGDHFYNNTAFNNHSSNFNLLGSNGPVGVLRNNIAYGRTPVSNATGVDDAFNSWTLPVTISDADFLSISTAGVDGPRRADGSLPDIGFMRLEARSGLINRGLDVGLPFNGDAPDLGAFETGTPLGGSGSSGSADAGAGSGTGGRSDADAAFQVTGSGGTSNVGSDITIPAGSSGDSRDRGSIESGCSCRATGATESRLHAGVVAALAWAMAIRRRRSQAASTNSYGSHRSQRDWNGDPELKGRISYRCMKVKDSADYYHVAEAADDDAPKLLSQRAYFQRYTEETKRVAGGLVEVFPLEIVAET